MTIPLLASSLRASLIAASLASAPLLQKKPNNHKNLPVPEPPVLAEEAKIEIGTVPDAPCLLDQARWTLRVKSQDWLHNTRHEKVTNKPFLLSIR